MHSEPGADLGAATPALPSCQGDANRRDSSAGERERKCQSRNSWLSPQWKGDVSVFPKDLQGSNTVEKGNETLSARSQELPGDALGRKQSCQADDLAPKTGFEEGLLWNSTDPLDSRLSWAAARAGPGSGLGALEGRAGRGR